MGRERRRERESGREAERMGAARGQHNKKSRSGSVNKMPNSSTCHNFSLARCRRLPPPPTSFTLPRLRLGFCFRFGSLFSSFLVQLIPYSLFVIPITSVHTHTHRYTDRCVWRYSGTYISRYSCQDVQHKQTRREERIAQTFICNFSCWCWGGGGAG